MKNDPRVGPGTRPPIYRDAAFAMGDTERMKRTFIEEQDHPREPENYIYSRYRNPTVVAAEERLMRLEGCRWALLTQSGMAAVDTALALFQQGQQTGTWLFFSEIYGGTLAYIDRVLRRRRGLAVEFFEPSGERYDLAALEAALDRIRPDLVFLEAVSNPMLIVADCARVIALAKAAGAAVVMDNTFATPLLCRPLELGADIVVHSATKYLGGHNDVTAGVICGDDPELMREAVEYRKLTGHMLAAGEAYALETRLKTFRLRVAAQNDNAARLAALLERHPAVAKVLYPGLESHPTREEARALFGDRGAGAVITFDLEGPDPEEKARKAGRFLAALEGVIPLVPTLGDVDSILLHVESVWGEKYSEPGMFRLSVGIEEYDPLERAVLAGLDAVR